MKKVRNAILSVVLTLCMTVPTITVYADDTSNAQADTEESATETNQVVTEENTDTEAVEEARKMGCRGRELAERMFNDERCAKEVAEVIKEISL